MSRKTVSGRKAAYGAAAVALAMLGGGLITTASATEVTGITLDSATRSGPTAGGVGVVIITGTGFAADNRVWFGQTEAAGVRFISATRLEVTPPARTAPTAVTVDVSVTTAVSAHAENSGDGDNDYYQFTDSTTITAVKLDPLPDSEFSVPQGFQEMKMPNMDALMGGKPDAPATAGSPKK